MAILISRYFKMPKLPYNHIINANQANVQLQHDFRVLSVEILKTPYITAYYSLSIKLITAYLCYPDDL
jgi:hypothetical protein